MQNVPEIRLEGESSTERFERWIKRCGNSRTALLVALDLLEQAVVETQPEILGVPVTFLKQLEDMPTKLNRVKRVRNELNLGLREAVSFVNKFFEVNGAGSLKKELLWTGLTINTGEYK